ncbi:MAG: 50S ribosomal protein L11 methyltransferase [Actinomycetota bacterium]|nr:50S ribosomal protein L11 methyltransferase [Actinomycetota bacterium]
MLADRIRTKTYQRAIASILWPGATVVDLGAGTGILSLFCAAERARKVYAVERSGIADVARERIEENEAGSGIDLIVGDIAEIDLPEPVDVIVCELMGPLGVE